MKHFIDYLRLSTWNQQEYMYAAADLRRLGAGWRKAKWLQYCGNKNDEYFHGIGQQKGQRHCVLQASGPSSSKLFDLIAGNDHFYCNRIDLQMTIQEPENYEPRELYDDVRTIPGNKRNTSLILSNTGSTVYFGNRTSDTFARCYQKEIEGQRFLRLELEIKGVTARYTYENLRKGNLTSADAYNYLLKRFKKPDYLEKLFDTENEVNGQFEKFEALKYTNSKLQWLMGLEATIVKMGNDHATGQGVKTWLEHILGQIDTV